MAFGRRRRKAGVRIQKACDTRITFYYNTIVL